MSADAIKRSRNALVCIRANTSRDDTLAGCACLRAEPLAARRCRIARACVGIARTRCEWPRQWDRTGRVATIARRRMRCESVGRPPSDTSSARALDLFALRIGGSRARLTGCLRPLRVTVSGCSSGAFSRLLGCQDWLPLSPEPTTLSPSGSWELFV
ncbi:hypothetical protein MTO96_001125 [Rhipicephalus appendiculatus]